MKSSKLYGNQAKYILFSPDNKLTDEATYMCQQLNIDSKELLPRNLETFLVEG